MPIGHPPLGFHVVPGETARRAQVGARVDLDDPAARQEHAAYTSLVAEQDQIVAELKAAARHMATYRDLPMGTHDMQLMTSPEVLQAFEVFVKAEEGLLGLLQARIEQDRAMLTAIAGQTQRPI